MKDEELIGLEVEGFRFNSVSKCSFAPPMEKYIGVKGVIKRVNSDVIGIQFPNKDSWSYPKELVLKQLELNKEETDLKELFNKIKSYGK